MAVKDRWFLVIVYICDTCEVEIKGKPYCKRGLHFCEEECYDDYGGRLSW